MAKHLNEPRVLEEGIPGFDWSTCENPMERIKKNSQKTLKAESVTRAFKMVYGGEIADAEDPRNDFEDCVLYVGKFMYFTVDDVTHRGLKLSSPYVKEEIINKDDFSAYSQFKSYLLQNSNQVIGIVKKIQDSKIYVDVLEAYYKLWIREVEESYAKKEQPITVYDLELTRGGFLGKTNIWTISQLTGENYINTCFIPGSQIVLNIEHNFENWVDKSVQVLPQKFTTFSTAFSRNDNCLLCSRKQLLQYEGAKNLSTLYDQKKLIEKINGQYTSPEFHGTITGVIKTSKKCGAFVELDGQYITGMLPCETYELSSYKIGEPIVVRIKEFETTSDRTFIKNKNGNIAWPNMRVIFEK